MAKLSEVENAMSTVATGTLQYYDDQNTWPDCPTTNEVINSLGVGLGAVSRIFNLSISNANGMISATIQNIDPMVDGKTLMLTPTTQNDGSITWNWGWSADFPPQFRPKSGR
jgi:hypothetical protein